MRLALVTAAVMVAFAANSLLNRMALEDGQTGPAAFALLRLFSGALCLWALVARRSGASVPPFRPLGVGSLVLYVLGFSFAYVTLPAGAGALVLFGGVQITMFAGAVLSGEPVPLRRWAGAGIAFAGLVWLMAPGGDAALAPAGLALMVAAALGWGVYSLLGRGAADPLAMTAANFVYAVPVAAVVFALLPDAMSWHGAVLAILSGALTSGLGYALWYAVLPQLGAARGAIAQLTVPVIATAAGIALLGEVLTARFALATVLVLAGVLLSLLPAARE